MKNRKLMGRQFTSLEVGRYSEDRPWGAPRKKLSTDCSGLLPNLTFSQPGYNPHTDHHRDVLGRLAMFGLETYRAQPQFREASPESSVEEWTQS